MKKRAFLFLATATVLLAVACSPKHSLVPVIGAPIRDEAALDRIRLRINQEGIKTSVSNTGLVKVADEYTARRMRTILICEDLIPTNIDPWAIFNKERWTITDFERNVNLQRTQKDMITAHIKAIDDVDDTNVTIVFPKREPFRYDQNPVTASVIITPRPGSDITTNRKKIKGIQKLLKIAIEGLQNENIVITDRSGVMLNDFTGMAAIERKLIQQQEAKFEADVLRELRSTFSPDRIRDLNVTIDNDIFNLTQGERDPNNDRITVSVNIDGTWKWNFDEKGKPVILPDGSIEREYTPVLPEQLRAATLLVQNAIGYNAARGDSVTVHNIPFDRTAEFKREDFIICELPNIKRQIQMTVIILSGLPLLLISFIIFRRIAGHAIVTNTKNP